MEHEGNEYSHHKFETGLSEDEVVATANERADRFRALPGLIQEYYLKLGQPDQYGGVCIRDSMVQFADYRASDLAAGIPAAGKVAGPPAIETLDSLFRLRE